MQEAKHKTNQAVIDEQDYFNKIDNMTNQYINENGEISNFPESPIKDQTVADIVDKIQDTNKMVKDENGNSITIPGGFRVVADTEGNDVDYTYFGDKKPCVQDGIVIEDEEGNQFVWIPVGDIKNKDNTTTTITLGRYIFNKTNGTPDLRQAAYTDEKSDNYTEIVTIDSWHQELVSSSTNTSAKNLQDFVIKTKKNGGYYLARYEASKGIDGKAKSQFDKIAWTNITQSDAATEARNMYSSNYIFSDLINSYSWDTAIVFIQKYSGNSNYANKKSVNSSKLNTGKAGDKECNIHDMSSNCYEWSTEHSTNWVNSIRSPCVGRGGSYYNSSIIMTYRSSNNTASSESHRSFRSLCYLK